MLDFPRTRARLDEIDEAISRYDPALTEQARDLLQCAFEQEERDAPEGKAKGAIKGGRKRHGLRVSNVTRVIETSVNATPPRIEQVRKRGDTKQARKEYRLTPDGVALVEEKLRG